MESLERSSGGTSLTAALALCGRVDMFGVGLYSDSVRGDKRYVHMYDEVGVGHCANRSEPGILARYWKRHMVKRSVQRLVEVWRHDRLRQEVLLHLLHVLGMVQWVLPENQNAREVRGKGVGRGIRR